VAHYLLENEPSLTLVALGVLSAILALLTKPPKSTGDETAGKQFQRMWWRLFLFTAIGSAVAGLLGLVMGPSTN
jgi:hypothetical protein